MGVDMGVLYSFFVVYLLFKGGYGFGVVDLVGVSGFEGVVVFFYCLEG